MKKLLFITPHLSTGGQPQYLYKQIETLANDYEIYCIEWEDCTGGVLVVQRNKIKNLLGNRLITLGKNKDWILNEINSINPDIIHFQELPEYFVPYETAIRIYNSDRQYKIVETSHDSGFDTKNKLHFPDKFLMVSQFQVNKFSDFGIPCELVEYPIEYKQRVKSRDEILKELGLDPNVKHVVNVGLFTPRKNQAEIVEYAKELKDLPIQFHFIGNQADNFKHYWEPIMNEFPSNCMWWGERADVDTFYQMADLFLFTSRGHQTDRETMPLVIREAISWNVPSLIYNLDVYLNYFDKYKNINYLQYDNLLENKNKIIEILGINTLINVDENFDFSFIKEENKIVINYKKEPRVRYKISIKDADSNAPMYWFDATFENKSSYWTIPIPIHTYNFYNEKSFGCFLIEFYNESNKLVFFKEIKIKDDYNIRSLKLDIINPFDCLFNNYNEMFVERKYDCYELKNLDVVFDIGANNGLFTLLMLNDGAKKVYSFEPNKESLLNLNHMFSNEQRVAVVEKAVYINDSDLTFYIDPNNTTIGSVHQQHILENGSEVIKETVPAISLKTFIKQNNINNISLIKMDIEGAEYEILENLEDEVFDITESFLIEWHDNNDGRVQKLIDKLLEKGYNIEQIRNQNDAANKDLTFSYLQNNVGTFLAKKAKVDDLLTVVIQTYNHELYIEQAVNSVLMQNTLFNYKILVSDDCSTDSTFSILQKYKDIKNIEILKTNTNEGATPHRLYNIIKNIKSEFITILDADDYYTDPLKLQKQVHFLKNNSEYTIHSTGHTIAAEDAWAYGYTDIVDHFNCSTLNEVELSDNLDANYVAFGFMFRNNLIKEKSFPDWFFHKDIFDAYWALNNILLQYGKSKNEEWISGRYRITPNGQFGEKDEMWKSLKIKAQSDVLKKYLKQVENPIIIVDAFFHDKQCLNTFKKYLSFIKKLNLPIMLVTNSKFDASLIDDIDYIVYDSNNRLFSKKYNDLDDIVFWFSNDKYYISLGTPGYQKHGLSVLSNLYHSTNLAKSLGYTHFYRIEYDCNIEKIDKVKDIIDEVTFQNKKGLVYINENKFVSYQIWYFELEYFTKNFSKINNEDDYIDAKRKFNYNKDFVSAEEFIYNMIKISDGGFDNLIVKDAPFMHTDFGNCLWNTIMTPLESEKIYDGFISSVHRIAYNDGNVNRSPQEKPFYDSKVAIITWNCSSSNSNVSKIKITYPTGQFEEFSHHIDGTNSHLIKFLEITDTDTQIDITMNDAVHKTFIVNKTNIEKLKDVYYEHN